MACRQMDDSVKEYLLFRGLHATAKSIENELKGERDRAFCVDKIIEQMHGYISAYDPVGLTEYWSTLEQYIFVHVDQAQMHVVHRLKTSVQRVCLVTAVQAGRTDRVNEFFDKLFPHVHSQPDWKEWLALRYTKSPEETATFALYFTRQWQDTLFLSLHNFISIILSTMPKPALMSCEEDQKLISKLEEENLRLRKKIDELRLQIPEVGIEAEKTVEIVNLELPNNSDMFSVPSSVEFVDGFYLLTQENNVIVERQQPAKRSEQIKAFIRNIGAPAPAVVGKKLITPTPQSSTVAVTVASTSGVAASISGTSISQPSSSSTLHSSPVRKQPSADVGSSASGVTPPTATVSKINQKSVSDAQITPQLSTDSYIPDCPTPENRDYMLLSQDDYTEHTSSIVQCRCNHSGQSAASLDVDGVLKVWSLQSPLVTVATSMSKSTLTSLEWACKTDRLLLLGTKVGSVRVFDVKEKKAIKEVSTDATCPRVVALASSPQGAHFTCSSVGRLRSTGPSAEFSTLRVGKLSVWDLRTMKAEQHLSLAPGPIAVNSLVYNHNGHLLLTGAADGIVRLYDMTSRDCIAQWGGENNAEIYTVAFSADENSFYSLASDGKFSQWSIMKTGRKIAEYTLHSGASGPFVHVGVDGQRQNFTPRGRLFALDTSGRHVLTCAPHGGVIYRLDSGAANSSSSASLSPVLSLRGHQSPVVTVDWSPSVHYCVTAALDGRISMSTLLAQE